MLEGENEMKPVNASIARTAIIEKLDHHLQQVQQWSSLGSYALAAEYAAKADALIDLLETDDCGSYGGFDVKRGQPSTSSFPGKDRLTVRAEWVKNLPIAA